MDINEQLKATRAALAAFEHKRNLINNLPMEAIRRQEEMINQIDHSSVSKIVDQYRGYQKQINGMLEATSQLYKYQSMMNEMLKSPVLELINNIDDTCSFSSEISRNALLDHFKNLPENYILLEKSKNNTKEYIIKDTKTDSQLPVVDSTSAFGIVSIFDNISEEEAFNFYNYLVKYPMLGLNHEIGKKVFKEIKRSSLIEKSEIRLFRARTRSKGQERPFPEKEMFEPPFGRSSHGRYNLPGLNVLYTCDSFEGAIKEVKPGKGTKVDIIEWELLGGFKMLDLSEVDCPLVNYCNFSSDSDYNLKPSYLVPNFIAQCCDLLGVDGLIYKSDMLEDANNYVFFSPIKSEFEFVKMYSNGY